MRFGLLAFGLALLTGASTVNQGAPGHQGPWPVFISSLPDGGGGIQMVPCPFTVTEPDGGIAEFVDCDGSINWNQFNPAILWGVSPTGTGFFYGVSVLTSFPDGGLGYGSTTFGTVNAFSPGADGETGYAFRSSAGMKWQPDRSDSTNFTMSGGVHPGTYNNAWYTSDGGYCFHDGTCQITASSGGGWVDAGSNGAITNTNSPSAVRIGTTANLGGASLQIQGTGASHNVYQQWSDGTNSYELKGSGSSLEIISDTDIAIDISPNNTGNFQFRAAGASFFAPLNMSNTKITSVAAGTATADAARFGQVQETVAISGATLPGLSAANNLVIGSMTSNTLNGNTLSRASISITCLVAGVGAGSTAVNLNDATDTAGNPQVSVTEACACTPGAVSNASATGLAKTDTDQFNLALKSTASTDCATYPLFIVNGQVTLK